MKCQLCCREEFSCLINRVTKDSKTSLHKQDSIHSYPKAVNFLLMSKEWMELFCMQIVKYNTFWINSSKHEEWEKR